MLNTLRRRSRLQRLAGQLCAAISAQARHPAFYRRFAVADTVDGRFDLLALHAWLALEAIESRRRADLAQGVVNALFVRFDEGIRELGAGDIGMGRRMKTIANAFYGRLEAYRTAADETALAAAIARNVYRGTPDRVEPARSLAKYALGARDPLARSRIELGELDFGPAPAET